MKQKIKKIKSFDGTQLAYTKHGSGPPLVKTATYITHLEHDWENPTWKPLLLGLSRFNTLIRYDERGSGLSDWYARDYSWDSWIEDLKAVVDAEGLDEFNLFGQSQGSTVAVAFAARYPERVKKLVILGGYARGWLHRDLDETGKKEEQLIIDLIKLGWGKENPAFRKFFCSQVMPDANMDAITSFNELMKISTEPEIAAQLERHMHLSNVVEEAPLVQCPTLVIHSSGDASVPFKEGKLLASLIPQARFVHLNSNNHILQDDEPSWTVFWEELYEFLEVKDDYSKVIQYKSKGLRRVLRTILITDIVESTKMALTLGDERWIEMLEKHNELVLSSCVEYEGEVIKDTGDGFLVIFESATAALECARDLLGNFEETPINIRCGLHAGEIEHVSNDIRGLHVHLAARVLDAAGCNETWTTSLFKELMTSFSKDFESQGKFLLKGIEEKKTLYKVS